MKTWIAAAVLAVSCSSAFATSPLKCLDISNDYVLAGDGEAVMIRLKQNLCDSVDFSIMQLNGDTLKPWVTYTFQIGKGFKDSPAVWDQKYELIVTPDYAELTTKLLTDPNNCVSVTRAEFDNKANLAGAQTNTCDNGTPKTFPIKLLRLR